MLLCGMPLLARRTRGNCTLISVTGVVMKFGLGVLNTATHGGMSQNNTLTTYPEINHINTNNGMEQNERRQLG